MKRVLANLAGAPAVLGLLAGAAALAAAGTGLAAPSDFAAINSWQTDALCSVTGTPAAPPPRLHNNPPPVPTLLSPLDATVTTTLTPTFTWTAVRDPEGDSVIFQLQVDDNPDFSSPEIDTRGHAYASFIPERPLRGGTYCWRVRSIDDIEARSRYSAAFEVTITANATPLSGR